MITEKAIIQRLLTEYLDEAMQIIEQWSSFKEISIEERFDNAMEVSFDEQHSK